MGQKVSAVLIVDWNACFTRSYIASEKKKKKSQSRCQNTCFNDSGLLPEKHRAMPEQWAAAVYPAGYSPVTQEMLYAESIQKRSRCPDTKLLTTRVHVVLPTSLSCKWAALILKFSLPARRYPDRSNQKLWCSPTAENWKPWLRHVYNLECEIKLLLNGFFVLTALLSCIWLCFYSFPSKALLISSVLKINFSVIIFELRQGLMKNIYRHKASDGVKKADASQNSFRYRCLT